MTAARFWWLLGSAGVLFPLGCVLLSKTKAIRNWIVRRMNAEPFQDYVESPAYLWQLRIAGVVAVAMSIFFTYAALANR